MLIIQLKGGQKFSLGSIQITKQLIKAIGLIKSKVRRLTLSKKEAYSKIPNFTQNTAFNLYVCEFYQFSVQVQNSVSIWTGATGGKLVTKTNVWTFSKIHLLEQWSLYYIKTKLHLSTKNHYFEFLYKAEKMDWFLYKLSVTSHSRI